MPVVKEPLVLLLSCTVSGGERVGGGGRGAVLCKGTSHDFMY